MASSSRISCYQCHDSSFFRNGWRLRSGRHAQLCPRCAFVYEEGRFCETFHLVHDGWSDCESCGKARNQCLSLDPDVRARELNQEPSGQAQVEAQFWPQLTDIELQQVSRNPKTTVIPLFEKILTASDADLKVARLIIPRRCAEAFFPDISGSHGLRGLRIKLQDTKGNEWEFHYRYWLNGGSRIYVLEGLRDYMVSKKWQPGDTSYVLSSRTRWKGGNGNKRDLCWVAPSKNVTQRERCEKQKVRLACLRGSVGLGKLCAYSIYCRLLDGVLFSFIRILILFSAYLTSRRAYKTNFVQTD